MAFVRAIGRWTMTALVINCIIGGGIFGVPGELTRLLGRASPIAMIVAAIGMSVIVACVTEVAVQFSDAGGPYLYVRTALGRFLGMQVGWFHLLANIGAIAALSDLFIDYLPAVTGWKLNAWERGVLMAALIGIPAAANCLGVRSGAVLSNITTVAKLSPLVLLIVIGVAHFGTRPELIGISEIVSPGWAHWSSGLVLLLFAFCGWEGALIPSGEIEEPRRTIPFSLAVGLLGCAAIYALLQFITVATVGTVPTSRPLADTASLLLGHNGAGFVAIAVMISTYGWISGAMLYSPRLAYALAEQDDFPAVFARLHPRFRSPVAAVLLHAIAGWVLAISGTFLWVAALSAGSSMVYYAATCASLLPLRRLRGNAVALRVPFAPVLSVLAIFISVGLMFGLTRGQLALMLVTALIATGNWLWARGQYTRAARSMKAAS